MAREGEQIDDGEHAAEGPVVINSIMAAGERCGVAGETTLVAASKQGPITARSH